MMTKLTKVFIVGIVLVIIGLIIMLTVLGLNGWKLNYNYEIKTFECENDIDTLEYDFAVGTLDMEFYDGDKIYFEYPEHSRLKTAITHNNGKLSIVVDCKFGFWHGGYMFLSMPKSTLKIPKGTKLNLDFKLNAGDVKLASGEYGDIKIKINAGYLEIGDMSCGDFNMHINAGKFKVENLIANNATFDINAGTVNATNIETNNLKFSKINAGNTIIKTAKCTSISADVNAGDLKVASATVDSVKFDVNAGNVTMNIVGDQLDYNITIDKDSSNTNLNNQIGKDINKIIELDISGGSAKIYFV